MCALQRRRRWLRGSRRAGQLAGALARPVVRGRLGRALARQRESVRVVGSFCTWGIVCERDWGFLSVVRDRGGCKGGEARFAARCVDIHCLWSREDDFARGGHRGAG